MNIEKAIRAAQARQASLDSKVLPKASTKRIKSLTESLTEYHSQGYGIHFCFHDRSYYEPCTTCKRTKRDALHNLLNM